MALRYSDLKKYEYFSTLSEQSLAMLANKFVVANYPAGKVVINEGDAGDAFYFVTVGRLEMTRRTESGQPAMMALIGSGEGFGETALPGCSSRTCSVRATTAVILYQLAKADFDAIVENEPAFKKMLLKKAGDLSHFDVEVLQPFALLEPVGMYARQE